MRITDKSQLQKLIDKGLIESSAMQCLKKPRICSKRDWVVGHLCPLTPAKPADKLYHSLVQEFGRYHSGGLTVYELCFASLGRRWRLDMALPCYRLGFELDGWSAHGRMRKSFLRDREKSLWFERRGWRVIRFSANQVINDLDDVMAAVKDIIGHCHINPPNQWEVEQTAFDRSTYHEIQI